MYNRKVIAEKLNSLVRNDRNIVSYEGIMNEGLVTVNTDSNRIFACTKRLIH